MPISSMGRFPKPPQKKPASTKLLPKARKIEIIFKFGRTVQKYPKDKLCKVSTVFQAMLGGSFPIPKDGYRIQDVSAEGFALFLKGIDSVESDELNHKGKIMNLLLETSCLDEALQAHYASHKYAVTRVEKVFTSNISRQVNWRNVLSILQYSVLLGNIHLESKCWSTIEQFTRQVIESKDFRNISWPLLCSILENSHLKVNEFNLMKSVYNWCCYQNRQLNQNKKDTPENHRLREVLGVAFYKIRFPLMTTAEFSQAKQCTLLAAGEIADLESNFRKNSTFTNVARKYACQCRIKHLKCRLCVYNNRNSCIRPSLFRYKTEQGIDIDCDCKKYKSCPCYPNGVTAEILSEISKSK